MSDYADVQPASQPPPLQRPNGTAWGRALGILKDAFLEAAKRAVLARFPGSDPAVVAPVGALTKIAANYSLEPSLSDPSQFALLGAIDSAWDAWESAGTKAGLFARIQEMGITNVQIFEARDWAPNSPKWWRFWVVIGPVELLPGYPVFPFSTTAYSDGIWDDSESAVESVWGASYDPSDYLHTHPLLPGPWAYAMAPAWLAQLRAVIRKWKPLHAKCVAILLLSRGETFGTRVVTKPLWSSGQVWSTNGRAIYLEA